MKVEKDIKKIEKAIGIPAKEWAGRCHEISSALVDAGVVQGKVRYGHFLGQIAPSSRFFRRPIVQHGWVELADGSIVDPTRWVFEDVKPYIYHDIDIDDSREYDVGGNVWRSQNIRECPEWEGPDNSMVVPEGIVGDMLLNAMPDSHPEEIRAISVGQAFWVANLPVGFLGDHAKAVYEWLDENEWRSFVPIDNYRLVMEE